ncbi:hypothetical protein [Bacillus sp. USDA818B3_A]|uniref:hypothetical protein n=1 Tax=Bacillus sp. USDA818B3_A TaxID=2698834 RepID=UPI001368EBFC|nr:hypothetical protein [Bacillus sp. USDA818B3_A]
MSRSFIQSPIPSADYPQTDLIFYKAAMNMTFYARYGENRWPYVTKPIMPIHYLLLAKFLLPKGM